MSTSARSRQASGTNSRRSSKAASVSTVSNSDSDNQSHVTVDSETFSALYNRATSLSGQFEPNRLYDSEIARVSVDSAANVKAKRTTYMAYPNRLSDHTLKQLVGKGFGDSGALRVRHHRAPAGQPLRLSTMHELQCFNDARGSLFKSSTKRIETGRTSLADNLGLRPDTGDKSTLHSCLSGHKWGSDIYVAAARDDNVLEEHVHNISNMVFGAKPGAIRMPLKKSAMVSESSGTRCPPGSESYYYSFESTPGQLHHQRPSDQTAIPKSASPASARTPSAFVQQKVRRRAHNKAASSKDKNAISGDSIQYETLWTTPEDT